MSTRNLITVSRPANDNRLQARFASDEDLPITESELQLFDMFAADLIACLDLETAQIGSPSNDNDTEEM